MPDFLPEYDSVKGAEQLDLDDQLRAFRNEFHFPVNADGSAQLYFAGHSLGLMPKKAREYVDQELDEWAKWGVAGHHHGRHPWLPYHEIVTEHLAHIAGARPIEVVAMNSLTVNLHLMLASFYRPTSSRFKILIENNTFPSDKYAVDSQARFHGFDPELAIVELKPREGALTVSIEDIEKQIAMLGDSLALVMLGNCNYLSGQYFDIDTIVKASRKVKALVGFNLAHGAGNLQLKLHDHDVDFAVWCSYKYLNSGPGAIAGAFVHEKHLNDSSVPRFEGWWGHDKKSRFKMGPKFNPIPTVEAWQLSNPPILQLAALRASLELFAKASIPALCKKRDRLTGYLEWQLKKHLPDVLQIVTPKSDRGAMLCVRFNGKRKDIEEKLRLEGVSVDFREPDIFRIAPAPIYNSFSDVYALVQHLKSFLALKNN